MLVKQILVWTDQCTRQPTFQRELTLLITYSLCGCPYVQYLICQCDKWSQVSYSLLFHLSIYLSICLSIYLCFLQIFGLCLLSISVIFEGYHIIISICHICMCVYMYVAIYHHNARRKNREICYMISFLKDILSKDNWVT